MAKKTEVVIAMGSRSDLKVMKAAADILENFGVPSSTEILSAHRTPQLLEKRTVIWEASGVKVIIAGAGGAAHLPGMLASFSVLPVIGVPVTTTALGGLDSLLSIAQMPKGVPVATVAVDNSTNAALLAVEILATGTETNARVLRKKLSEYKKSMARQVFSDRKKLKKKGPSRFLKLKK